MMLYETASGLKEIEEQEAYFLSHTTLINLIS